MAGTSPATKRQRDDQDAADTSGAKRVRLMPWTPPVYRGLTPLRYLPLALRQDRPKEDVRLHVANALIGLCQTGGLVPIDVTPKFWPSNRGDAPMWRVMWRIDETAKNFKSPGHFWIRVVPDAMRFVFTPRPHSLGKKCTLRVSGVPLVMHIEGRNCYILRTKILRNCEFDVLRATVDANRVTELDGRPTQNCMCARLCASVALDAVLISPPYFDTLVKRGTLIPDLVTIILSYF